MTPKRIVTVALVLFGLAGAYYFYGGHSVPPGQPPLANLPPGDLAAVKAAFNGSASSVRVVLMLSPT